MKKYFVYILKSKIQEITYVGYSDNIPRRLIEHNSGKSIFTRKYKPWDLIYKEEFLTEEEALKREKYFKTAAGRRLIKKILSQLLAPVAQQDRATVS
ncbi:MAG: GIY-YIG nuclease family protein [Ignavibacteria bacterium]